MSFEIARVIEFAVLHDKKDIFSTFNSKEL